MLAPELDNIGNNLIVWDQTKPFPGYYRDIVSDPGITRQLGVALTGLDTHQEELRTALLQIQKRLPVGNTLQGSFQELVAIIGLDHAKVTWLVNTGRLTEVNFLLEAFHSSLTVFNRSTDLAIIHTHPDSLDVFGSFGLDANPISGWSPEDISILNSSGLNLKQLRPSIQRLSACLITAGKSSGQPVIINPAQLSDEGFGSRFVFNKIA